MFVQAKWLKDLEDEDAVMGKMSAAWAVKSNFDETLRSRLQGQTVQFSPGGDLFVVGGRSSIEGAFAAPNVAKVQFVPAQGETLFVEGRRKTHEKGRMLSMLPGIGVKMVTTESARSPEVRDMLGKMIKVSTKKYTLVHIRSGPVGPNDFTLPNPATGAGTALLLRHYFDSYMG